MQSLFLFFAGVAALIHIYIFILETFLWITERAQKVFGLSKDEAKQTRTLAANQGVYNGALAGLVIAGMVTLLAGSRQVGMTLILAGTSVMLIAALYLFATSRDKRSTAIKQGVFPMLTIISAVLMTV